MLKFENLAEVLLNLHKNLKGVKKGFLDELNLEKIPKKLENFEELSFDEFINELSKAKKIKFSDKLDERNFKNEWQRLFINNKNEVLKLKNEINLAEVKANELVYKLYDLSPDEINFIENSL